MCLVRVHGILFEGDRDINNLVVGQDCTFTLMANVGLQACFSINMRVPQWTLHAVITLYIAELYHINIHSYNVLLTRFVTMGIEEEKSGCSGFVMM